MGIDLPQAGALLLAGGASRRMGRDKAALPWRGGTFLERIAGELAGFPERYLSANLENCPLPPPWQLVADRFPGCGPLAGLHAGLCVCRSPWLVAVSCDLPLLQRPLVEWLARQAAPPYGAVVPRDQAGRIHPLCWKGYRCSICRWERHSQPCWPTSTRRRTTGPSRRGNSGRPSGRKGARSVHFKISGGVGTMFDVHDCIGFLTNHGAKAVGEAMNQQFKKKDLTRVQWMALYYIGQKGQMTQKDLANAMMISEPSAAHLVERLLQGELIHRGGSVENYRAKLLSLTEKGRETLNSLFPLVEEFNRQGTQGISPQDLDTFKRVMEQMIRNVQE